MVVIRFCELCALVAVGILTDYELVMCVFKDPAKVGHVLLASVFLAIRAAAAEFKELANLRKRDRSISAVHEGDSQLEHPALSDFTWSPLLAYGGGFKLFQALFHVSQAGAIFLLGLAPSLKSYYPFIIIRGVQHIDIRRYIHVYDPLHLLDAAQKGYIFLCGQYNDFSGLR
ncbi:MAG TPA: hypothetical protein PLQ01_02000 [Methanothrix sp.]|nr:hypothetical protein [Methanothrix sp.]